MKKSTKRRAMVLSLAMAAMLALPTMAEAQGSRSKYGGLFGAGLNANKETTGMLNAVQNRNGSFYFSQEEFGGNSGNFTHEEFGAPLGGGIAILLGACLGYATLKRSKED